jgi:hypothetical protein
VDLPGPRDCFNRVERLAAPVVNDVTHSEEFARLAALLGVAGYTVRSVADGLAARGWHALNLPAGTDIRRLGLQLGALDREVRLLGLELERSRSHRDGEPS